MTSDLQVNLLRLDFTCNAIFYDSVARAFIDVTGCGLHDGLQRLPRIPCPQSSWDLWFGVDTRKAFRYWKMRRLGFSPADTEPHYYLIQKTVEQLTDDDDKERAGRNFCKVLGVTPKRFKEQMGPLKQTFLQELKEAASSGKIAAKDVEASWATIAEAFLEWESE